MKKIMLRFSSLSIHILLIIDLMILSAVDFLYSQEKEGDDEQEQSWSVSSGANYYSRYTRYGVDLSEDRSAFSFDSEISYQSGLSAGFEVFALNGSDGGYEHSSFHAGYEYPLSTSIKLTGRYTYYSYKTDTLSVLAGIVNELSIGGSLEVSRFLFSVTYNAYFGGGSADYLTTGALANYKIGELTLEPSVQISFVSQTVNQSLLPKNRGKGKGNKQGGTSTVTTTITGLSNLSISLAFRYPLGKGFVTSVIPSYVYSPTDLAASATQFIMIIGLEHSIDF
jgi:hypothetical protein